MCRPKPTLIKGGENPKTLYIVEGIYDAFTLLSNSKCVENIAVWCLNSCNNENALIIDHADNLMTYERVILAVDSDERGQQTFDFLSEWYKERNFKVEKMNLKIDNVEYKDVNEYWRGYIKKYRDSSKEFKAMLQENKIYNVK